MKTVIVGKAASGKDYLRKLMMQRGGKYGVSYTTRPPRAGEENGVDYLFTTEEDFLTRVERGEMIEYQQFNGWYYGMTKEVFDQCEVMILNVEGLAMLSDEIRKQCFVIYVDIEQPVRIERLGARKDVDDAIWRRIQADEEQFKNFTDYDIRITNPDF
jgi:guanylate kinase